MSFSNLATQGASTVGMAARTLENSQGMVELVSRAAAAR
jgi:hypothetical protein